MPDPILPVTAKPEAAPPVIVAAPAAAPLVAAPAAVVAASPLAAAPVPAAPAPVAPDPIRIERDTLLAEAVTRDLETFKDVIADPVAMKEKLLADRAGTVKLLQSIKAPAQPALHSRFGKPTPGPASAGDKVAEEKQANQIRDRATEIKKGTPALTFDQAWAQAKSEAENKR